MKIEKIKEILKAEQAVIIDSYANRKYLTGFSSSAGIIYISKRRSVLLIDFRYFEKAKREVDAVDVVLLTNTYNQINDLIADEKITSLYVETDSVSLSQYNEYCKNLNAEILCSSELSETLFKLRRIKSSRELSYIKTAQEYTEQTFKYILERIEVGRTEQDVMLDMEFYIRKLGSEGVAFDFIVVSGNNSSLPHGVPTDRKICPGDFITFDFGARYNGYCSDMTRTVAVGYVTEEQKKVYNTVLEAQLASLDAIKPGTVCKDVDKIARDIISNAGYEGCFGHGLGHSLGIEVHESPSFNTRCETVLEPGMVMTVEPGVYLDGKFGVRIEDMVCLTQNGMVNLTTCEKNLIIL